jgi:hypothetical protein
MMPPSLPSVVRYLSFTSCSIPCTLFSLLAFLGCYYSCYYYCYYFRLSVPEDFSFLLCEENEEAVVILPERITNDPPRTTPLLNVETGGDAPAIRPEEEDADVDDGDTGDDASGPVMGAAVISTQELGTVTVIWPRRKCYEVIK